MGYIPTKSVVLNGKDYIVDGGVQVTPLASWADPLRVVGNPRRGDRVNAAQWNQENFTSGLGYESMTASPIDDARQPDLSWYGFYGSTLETRWKGQITLPGLSTANVSATSSHFHRYLTTSTQGSAIVPTIYGGDEQSIESTTSGWNNFVSIKDVTSGYTSFQPRCDVLRSDGGQLFLGGDAVGNIPAKVVYRAASGTVTDISPSANVTGVPLSAVNFKNIIYTICWVAGSDRLELNQSTNDGAAFSETNAALRLGYSTGQNRLYAQLFKYLDANGQPAIYLDTDAGLYILDLGNNEWGQIIKYDELPDNTLDTVTMKPQVYNGFAYLPRNGSLFKFHYSGDWQDVSPFTTGRAAITTGEDTITAMTTGGSWLFVAVKNSATFSSIWAYDGTGFHYIWSITGTGVTQVNSMLVFDGDLGILYNDLGGDTHDMVRVPGVLSNPLTVTGKTFATTGNLITPWFDGGMTEVDCNWLQMGAGYKDLDTTSNNNEKIKTETALGYSDTYESATGTVLTWYSDSSIVQKFLSGAGMDSPVMRQKHTLTRGSTTTKTPVLFYPVVYYDKVFTKLHKYTFIVDVKKTANQGALSRSDEQDVLNSLETTFAKVPQSTFKFPGIEIYLASGVSVDYVRIVDIQTIVEVDGNPNAVSPRMDSGRVQVTVEAKV